MKPSLMWPSARPNSAVNIQAVCPRLGVQDAMARPWSTSIKSHSPPAGRYVQPLHATLALPRGPMGVFTPVVEIATLAVFDPGQDLALRRAVALELIGNNDPWHVL